MGKPHPIELRERAVELVEQGHTHTETAMRLCVSIKFVNDMVRLKRETGALDPKPQGRRGHGKLAGVHDWVGARPVEHPETTLDELVAALWQEHGIDVQRSAVWGLLHRLGLSHKKRLARQRAEAA